jgi:hypothetical protein
MLHLSNMQINAEWHGNNRMPKNPTMNQRIEWHVEHAKNCGCRPIPNPVQKEIEKRGVSR